MNKEKIYNLPKGELHVHLNGLINSSIAERLIYKHHPELSGKVNIQREITRDKPASNLAEYLKPWSYLRCFPIGKDELKEIIASAFEELKSNNVKFVELRSSIIYISLLNKISIEESLEWLISEVSSASNTFEIPAGIIATISRGDYACDHLNSIISAYRSLGSPKEIIGLDLAGNEDDSIPSVLPDLFKKAKDEYGLGITIHAGETGNPENIVQAIELFNADRIGHGTAAIQSEKTMDTIRKKDICIEVCPISNRLTNAVKSQEPHPLVRFIENELPFVICSDNPAIHNKGLSDDYIMFLNESRNEKILHEMFERQSKYSFLGRRN